MFSFINVGGKENEKVKERIVLFKSVLSGSARGIKTLEEISNCPETTRVEMQKIFLPTVS